MNNWVPSNVILPILLSWSVTSEMDVDGRAVEVEPSGPKPIFVLI